VTQPETIRVNAEIAHPTGNDPFAAAVRATRMPMVISDPRQPDNPIVFANDSFCRLSGYSRNEIVGRNCRFLQGKNTDPAAVARIRAAVKGEQAIEIDIRNYRKNGTTFWNRLLMAPVHDSAGKLAYFFASQVDVTLELDRLEGLETHNAALLAELSDRLRSQADSEARLQMATQAGRMGIWELDLARLDLIASPICHETFGRGPADRFTYDDMKAAIHPADRPRFEADIAAAIASGAEYDSEYRVIRDADAVGWLQIRAQVLRDTAGKPTRMAGVLLDVSERRAAEERLELSEESLRLATESAEVGTWDLDTVHNLLTWTDRVRAMFGISPGTAVTLDDFYAGLHPEDREATSIAFARALDPALRDAYDVEYRTVGREDGVVRWVAARGRALFDDEGHCFRALGTAIDITARRAEADRQAFLLRLLDQLRTRADPLEIMQTAIAALCRYLGVARGGFGHLYEDGDRVRLEAGYAESTPEIDGVMRLSMFGAPADRALHENRVALCENTAELEGTDPAAWDRVDTRAYIAVPLVRGEKLLAFMYVAHASPRAWLPWEVALVGDVSARIWDAVARAQAENSVRETNASLERLVQARTAELQASQARMRAVFQTSYQLQAFLALDGTLLDANVESLAVINRTFTEVAGLKFWESPWFIETEGVPEIIRDAVQQAAAGQEVRREVTILVPAGLRTYDFSARPIRDESGAVVAVLPEAMDITDRRQAEEQLRQAQKMEAVGQLTGGIAHDFNNLLTGIVGSLELLQRRVTAGRTDGLLRYAAAAAISAQRAASLTQRLLAFARRQPLDPKRVDANRLLSGMEDMLRRTLGPAIELEMVLGAGLWPTLSDPHQLESAILNLAINARDAMPDGGRLVIETVNTRLDEAYARSQGGEVSPGAYVLVSVTDSGTGMPPDVIAKAFDPFFTTKPIGQGTGLGLSMLYGFIKQSNGHVRIYSEMGVGTTFKLYLPRERGDAAEDAEDSGVPVTPAKAGDGETVLVVEDELTVRMLVTETLAELGYAALEAHDGPSGLRVLQSDARVDLLVTDVGLPGLNGRQLADAARLIRPGLRVLFMTGYAHNAAIGQGTALEVGMEIISKPFALDALAGRIRGMIEGG
jgi:PAS domain S-box-containing protein